MRLVSLRVPWRTFWERTLNPPPRVTIHTLAVYTYIRSKCRWETGGKTGGCKGNTQPYQLRWKLLHISGGLGYFQLLYSSSFAYFNTATLFSHGTTKTKDGLRGIQRQYKKSRFIDQRNDGFSSHSTNYMDISKSFCLWLVFKAGDYVGSKDEFSWHQM